MIVVEKDPKSNNHLWVLRVKKELPCYLSVIIGDAIHNLRVSLDLLASDLVSRAGGNTRDVYFPFGEDADSFEKLIKKRKIDRAGEDIIEIIRSLKPYKGGNKLLRALHDLDITDKHKALIPSVHYAGIEKFQMMNAHSPLLKINNLQVGPIQDGMVIMSLPPANNISIGQTFQPSLTFTFKEVLSDRNIIRALEEFTSLTEGIINLFVKHFEVKKIVDMPPPEG